ncbi:hypothetical protein [Paenibacillus sp. FSL K6-1230]|uniref:hypothetical protein n=1 Tax=Paenibacillus sp. FSL K6-1230 TaxID=2921603 RepID=UPI0030F7307A
MKNGKDALSGGNVVKSYKTGDTTIDICDDHIVKTKHEVDEIIKEMHRIAWKLLTENYKEMKKH